MENTDINAWNKFEKKKKIGIWVDLTLLLQFLFNDDHYISTAEFP